LADPDGVNRGSSHVLVMSSYCARFDREHSILREMFGRHAHLAASRHRIHFYVLDRAFEDSPNQSPGE
jgi:hypothetical protein